MWRNAVNKTNKNPTALRLEMELNFVRSGKTWANIAFVFTARLTILPLTGLWVEHGFYAKIGGFRLFIAGR